MAVKVAVVGAAGYAGGELFRLLANHPGVKLVGAYDVRNVGKTISEVHPNLRGVVEIKITEPDYDKIGREVELVFVATPHGVAMNFVPKLLAGGAKVVDLSADYRFDDVKVFESYYVKHESPSVKGVYGLPELHRAKIKTAKLVANPGCFPTAAVLSIAPLVKTHIIDLDHIVFDSKTGTSGAGATLSEATHHPIAGVNVKAYSATTHRHSPEIDQELSKLAGTHVRAHFTPHLLPLVSGLLSTAHVFLKKRMKMESLMEIYRDFYEGEPFVRLWDELPEVNFVSGSNYCDIGIEVDAKSNRVVAVSAIDNLIKGAAGQAIQNMNIMLGFDEMEGLRTLGLRP